MEITSKKWLNELITLAASMLTTVALFADVESTGNLSMALNGDGIPQLIALAVVWAVYSRWIVENKLFVRTD